MSLRAIRMGLAAAMLVACLVAAGCSGPSAQSTPDPGSLTLDVRRGELDYLAWQTAVERMAWAYAEAMARTRLVLAHDPTSTPVATWDARYGDALASWRRVVQATNAVAKLYDTYPSTPDPAVSATTPPSGGVTSAPAEDAVWAEWSSDLRASAVPAFNAAPRGVLLVRITKHVSTLAQLALETLTAARPAMLAAYSSPERFRAATTDAATAIDRVPELGLYVADVQGAPARFGALRTTRGLLPPPGDEGTGTPVAFHAEAADLALAWDGRHAAIVVQPMPGRPAEMVFDMRSDLEGLVAIRSARLRTRPLDLHAVFSVQGMTAALVPPEGRALSLRQSGLAVFVRAVPLADLGAALDPPPSRLPPLDLLRSLPRAPRPRPVASAPATASAGTTAAPSAGATASPSAPASPSTLATP